VAVHLSEIIKDEVIFVVSVVFLENGCDFFFCFVSVRFGVHCFHEFDEADTSSFLSIKLSCDLIGGFSVRIEAILREEKLEIIGKQYCHTCGVISIEYFFEIDDVLIGEGACYIEFWLELA